MDGAAITGVVLHAAVAGGAPILLAGLGELLAERSGVLNLGVEGLMALGAVVGFAAAAATGSPALGFAAAALAGAMLAALHALPVAVMQVNQVVSGLALLLLGQGLAITLGHPLVGHVGPSLTALPFPGLSAIPVLGPAFFSHNLAVYGSYAAALATGIFLSRTRAGLTLEICGENPRLADSSGVDVAAWRVAATCAGGALAGIGGAVLSLSETPGWVEGMVAGRGWIALAMVIFAGWRPGRLVLGSWLFGGLVAVQFRAQAFGLDVPATVLKMMPYLATVAVLAATGRGGRGAPMALGRAYVREERT